MRKLVIITISVITVILSSCAKADIVLGKYSGQLGGEASGSMDCMVAKVDDNSIKITGTIISGPFAGSQFIYDGVEISGDNDQCSLSWTSSNGYNHLTGTIMNKSTLNWDATGAHHYYFTGTK